MPHVAENWLEKRPKIWIPFFLQVINPIATLVYCVLYLIPSAKIHLTFDSYIITSLGPLYIQCNPISDVYGHLTYVGKRRIVIALT